MRRIHRPFVVAEEGDHRFVWLGLDEAEAEKVYWLTSTS